MPIHPIATPIHILKVNKPDYDLRPLGEGMMALRNAFDARDAEEQQAQQRAAAQQQAAANAETERQATARKYVDNVLTTLDPRDPEFGTKWKGHLDYLRKAGHQIGPEYDDPSIGYNLALAEVTDAKTRGTWRNQQRDDDLRSRELNLREREIDDKSLSRNRRDLLKAVEVMKGATTPEQWQAAQPIIQTAFGRPVAFNDRNIVLAQAQSNAASADAFEPTYDEQQLGITRQMKMESARSQRLGEMFGKKGEQKEGYRYDIRNGQVEQVPTTEKADEIKKREGIVNFHLNTLDSAEKAMLNSSLAGRAIGIGLDYGEVGQAAADWENAVLGLVYERSGKQTAVAEMKQWINTYGPKAGDSEWRVKTKLQRVRDFYKSLTGEDMPKGQTGANDVKGMSDDDLLKALGQ